MFTNCSWPLPLTPMGLRVMMIKIMMTMMKMLLVMMKIMKHDGNCKRVECSVSMCRHTQGETVSQALDVTQLDQKKKKRRKKKKKEKKISGLAFHLHFSPFIGCLRVVFVA